MDDLEESKRTFLEFVAAFDPAVDVVIPTTPSQSLFKISFSKGGNRKFITIHEDDILDLPEEPSVQDKTKALIRETIEAL